MPAKSKKQKKFMQAVANNPKFAKKVGVPTKVGKEFTKETKMKKKVKKYEGGGPLGEAPAAMVRIREGMQKAEEDQRQAMRERQKMRAEMGRAAQAKPPMRKGMSLEEATRLGAPIAAGAQLRGMMPPPQERSPYAPMPPGMKKGGAVKSKSKSKTNCRRGDGICKQGKTKGRMV